MVTITIRFCCRFSLLKGHEFGSVLEPLFGRFLTEISSKRKIIRPQILSDRRFLKLGCEFVQNETVLLLPNERTKNFWMRCQWSRVVNIAGRSWRVTNFSQKLQMIVVKLAGRLGKDLRRWKRNTKRSWRGCWKRARREGNAVDRGTPEAKCREAAILSGRKPIRRRRKRKRCVTSSVVDCGSVQKCASTTTVTHHQHVP